MTYEMQSCLVANICRDIDWCTYAREREHRYCSTSHATKEIYRFETGPTSSLLISGDWYCHPRETCPSMSEDTLSQPFREYRGFNLQVIVKFMKRTTAFCWNSRHGWANKCSRYIHTHTDAQSDTDHAASASDSEISKLAHFPSPPEYPRAVRRCALPSRTPVPGKIVTSTTYINMTCLLK
jgi:hypothetical protein